MGLARPCAALALLLTLAFCGGPGSAADPRETEVPLPTNVKIKTYNFNTSLHWDYQNTLPDPVFTVQICCYGETYIDVSSCVNISQHYCDLTHKINDKCRSLWAKVKALFGPSESEYEESEVFHSFRNAQIGPPEFNLSVENDEIIVDIAHPLTPYNEKDPLTVRANLTDFTYRVFLWKQGSPEKDEPIEPEECDERVCIAYLQASVGSTYCVSVQGISEVYSLTGEESEPSCINLYSGYPLGVIGAIIGAVTFFVAVVVVAVWLTRRWVKQINIPLPKSLVSVVRRIKPVNTFETERDGKYTTVSSLAYQPVCEDGKSVEPIDHVTEAETSDLEDPDKIVIESQTIQEARAEESCETGQSHEASDTYFKSASGQEETFGNSLPNGDVPKADAQRPPDLEASRKVPVSGYDKPHWI